MSYNLIDLIKDAHIDSKKLDEEVEHNSGKHGFLAGRFADELERHESAKIKLLALEGSTQERVVVELKEEIGKAPSIPQVKARLDQDEVVIAARLKVVGIGANVAKLKTLLITYEKRFGMLQTRVASIREEMKNVKTGL